jgi:thioredoxin 1
MAENVPEVDEKEFDTFIKKGYVLIDFFADWCMPCLMMGPIIEELSDTFKGKIKFGKVNVSDSEGIARKFNISSIPNFILFKDGKAVESFVGAMSAEDFEEKLKKLAK